MTYAGVLLLSIDTLDDMIEDAIRQFNAAQAECFRLKVKAGLIANAGGSASNDDEIELARRAMKDWGGMADEWAMNRVRVFRQIGCKPPPLCWNATDNCFFWECVDLSWVCRRATVSERVLNN